MKRAYPIQIQRDGDFFVVFIPDFSINTQGRSIPEAMEMARDAIGMTGVYMQDEGKPVPSPSRIESMKAEERLLVTLVDVDFEKYRRQRGNHAVQ